MGAEADIPKSWAPRLAEQEFYVYLRHRNRETRAGGQAVRLEIDRSEIDRSRDLDNDDTNNNKTSNDNNN